MKRKLFMEGTPAVKAALRERCFRPENSAYGQEYAQSL